MNERRYRAWRFDHPDFDDQDGPPGLKVSPQGTIDWVDGTASVRQAILLLLSTAPGERVMRPEYGCELHRLLFAPNDDTTAGLAIHYVRRAIERWEPRVEIVHLDATRNAGQSELLDILLEYRVLTTQQVDQIAFSLSLTGEET
jgi:phage baseplate assembly protein W